MKIAFIQKDAYEKIGVHQLAGCLKNNNFELDLFIEQLEPNFYDKIVAFQPDFILYSLFIGEESYMLEYFSKLKKLLPNVKTLIGGPFTLIFPKIIKNEQIDFMIRGDGEYSLPLFLKTFQENGQLENIPGIGYIKEDGSIFINKEMKMTADLTVLPDPDRDLYYKYKELKNNKTKLFIASRGCPFNCTYCYNSEINKCFTEIFWRQRSGEAVCREIEYVRDTYGLQWVHFQDGTFNSSIPWLKSFLKEYQKRNLPPFLCNCRLETINEEIVILLKNAGCERITFGIQSGNFGIREKIGRKMSNEKIEEVFNLCHKYNIRVGADIIFGFPGETLEKAMETIYLCRKIKPDSCHSNVLILYPDLSITREAVQKGFLKHEPNLKEIENLNPNKSLLNQSNIKLLINLDKLSYFMINFPKSEKLLKFLLRLPPNKFFLVLKNLHMLKRSLKYDSKGILSSLAIIKNYLKEALSN
ncbi:MAG: radical SAM protein [Candidatus Staskawiczbacteria bacterium]|nr:radical SAM protein [Candidatus Staskawiczbacteria bacterium]